MLILLPPSEGKSTDRGAGRTRDASPDLIADAEKVLNHAKRLKAADRAKFYGAKDAAKSAAIHKLNLAAPDAPCMKALERYAGVVYQHLDYANLSRKRDAEKRIWIVSGLWGLISGGACIPEYKLPMNKWLADYWRPINRERLERAAKGKPVLNLLSQAYAKAIDYDNLLTVDFKVEGGKKSAGHFGKAIKGRFVRYLIDNRITTPEDFAGFNEEGYTFDGENFIRGG